MRMECSRGSNLPCSTFNKIFYLTIQIILLPNMTYFCVKFTFVNWCRCHFFINPEQNKLVKENYGNKIMTPA